MTALLTLDNVSRRFGGLNAVDGVSFSVDKGEIVGLIGPNGAGKTTLINLITGVHPATAGRVHFEDSDITRAASLPDRAARPRAHLSDRAAVPEDDGGRQRRRRRAVLRPRRQRARGAGDRPRASRLHRALPTWPIARRRR